MHHQHLIIIIVAVVGLGVFAQWVAWRTRLPAIVLLALAGVLAGPVFGFIDPSAEFGEWLQPLISLCVAIILFEGGLSLSLRELKEASSGVRRLVYLGAPLAWCFASLCAHYIGGLDWPVSLVFGAIMVVTGPTVIMPLLRQSALQRRTASFLKWEGIVNDPIGALLAVLVFQFLMFSGAGSGWGEIAGNLMTALAAGLIGGGLGGFVTARAFQAGLVPEYLKSPIMLGLVLIVYVLANLAQDEAGLLAVTIMGVVVANMDLPGIGDMRRFKEYITIMLVSVVFVLLTADLNVASLTSIGWRGVALVLSLLFIARPAAILLATIGAEMSFRERLLVAWIAPRGIVAAATAGVLGSGLVAQGFDAEILLPLVFAVIFATVFAHGLSINWLAMRLGLASTQRDSVLVVGASPWSVELGRTLTDLKVNVLIADSSWHNLRAARLAGLPVFYGEILSEFAEESLEISHVRTVLAATSNDAYNSLVCTQIAPEVGQRRVFQLPLGNADDDPKSVARTNRGNIAFGRDVVFEKLWRLYVRGWKFYKTRLSESYSYSDFLGERPADSIEIAVLTAEGHFEFLAAMHEREPRAGETLIYFAPGRDPSAQENGNDKRESART
ncbi:MAG: sodium:proton antiporter [Pseudomonadota bacterium]